MKRPTDQLRAELTERRRIGDAIVRELAELTMPGALDRLTALVRAWRAIRPAPTPAAKGNHALPTSSSRDD